MVTFTILLPTNRAVFNQRETLLNAGSESGHRLYLYLPAAALATRTTHTKPRRAEFNILAIYSLRVEYIRKSKSENRTRRGRGKLFDWQRFFFWPAENFPSRNKSAQNVGSRKAESSVARARGRKPTLPLPESRERVGTLGSGRGGYGERGKQQATPKEPTFARSVAKNGKGIISRYNRTL